ncbi:NAD dependent epimerase/dehydratase family protein [Streptomyces sp. ADI96-02]|uniref:SDR family oxidoreductase n=1 Tax=unclassified Streptomyces TaxID=2593676 RepID=UPI000F54FB8F|nr:SDR family oxidoreductase [Streptomyces sp. ADI96-02]RPK54586.1 NAD dependent epimerase/dehydratase family protein [Streptomyces sp. ADI96-02]
MDLGSVLVAGAGGVIGRSMVEDFAARGTRTRGVSRRAPQAPTAWEHLSADLSDPAAARDGLRAAADTDRLVFAAYVEQTDPVAQVATNVELLDNTLQALAANDAPLKHVTLYQGHKFYGSHLGRFKTPAKEDDPRLIGPNFYYDQEDLLRTRAEEMGFRFTVFRPEAVMGYAQGTPMNLLMVIAAYVAISKELGLPLRFPGARAAYDDIFYQMTDARLLASATHWAGSAPGAADEVFNITNGDVVRWSHLWRAVAAHYGMTLEEPKTIRLEEHMPSQDAVWQRIVAKHDLVPTPYGELVDWRFGDMIFHSAWDNVSSTIKLRHAGFQDSFDSEQRLLELLDDLGRRRIVPPASS